MSFALNNIHTPTNRQAKNTDFETRTHTRRISQLFEIFARPVERTKPVLDSPFLFFLFILSLMPNTLFQQNVFISLVFFFCLIEIFRSLVD